MSIKVEEIPGNPTVSNIVSFTHLNYENIPDWSRPLHYVSNLRPPKAVSAAFVATSSGVLVALAITGRKDKFSRATGRHIAATRLEQFKAGQLSVDEQNKFIRFIPSVEGEELTEFVRSVISKLGFSPTSAPAQLITDALTNSTPLDQTVDFTTRIVRDYLKVEFGHGYF